MMCQVFECLDYFLSIFCHLVELSLIFIYFSQRILYLIFQIVYLLGRSLNSDLPLNFMVNVMLRSHSLILKHVFCFLKLFFLQCYHFFDILNLLCCFFIILIYLLLFFKQLLKCLWLRSNLIWSHLLHQLLVLLKLQCYFKRITSQWCLQFFLLSVKLLNYVLLIFFRLRLLLWKHRVCYCIHLFHYPRVLINFVLVDFDRRCSQYSLCWWFLLHQRNSKTNCFGNNTIINWSGLYGIIDEYIL